MPLSFDQLFGRVTCLVVIGGITAATICSPAVAGEAWSCNAPNGQYDYKTFAISEKTTNINGQIVFHNADFNPKWASLAHISVAKHGADTGDCHCSGIAIYAIAESERVEFHSMANGDHVGIAQSRFETPVTFNISFSPQGVMTVAMGKTHPEISTVSLLHPEHDVMELSCSGSYVSFLNVVVS